MGRQPLHDDAQPDAELPGAKNIAIYCDESGTHGGSHYGFGSLWVSWDRRGDLSALLDRIRQEHSYDHEVKWSNVTRQSLAFYKAVVTAFFSRRWLMFHGVVFARKDIRRSEHATKEEQYLKHLGLLIRKKVVFFAARKSGRVYRLLFDELPHRYKRSHEVALKIANAEIKKVLGETPIHDARLCDSARTAGIQLADLLIGCVLATWQGAVTSAHKRELIAHVADHMGWADMLADTRPDEWKCNIWYFYDPTSGPRRIQTRAVRLKYEMPRLPPALDPKRRTHARRRAA